jgi:hypothetical protein
MLGVGSTEGIVVLLFTLLFESFHMNSMSRRCSNGFYLQYFCTPDDAEETRISELMS